MAGREATSAEPPAWRRVVGPCPSFAVAQVTAWLEACVDKCLQDECLCTYVHSKGGTGSHGRKDVRGTLKGIVGTCAVTEPCAVFVCLCRYEGTGPYWMPQRWYKCKSCTRDEVGVDGGVGLCASCARSCHEGHELVEQEYSPFYCDCPLGGFPSILCRKRRQPKVASNTTEAASIS